MEDVVPFFARRTQPAPVPILFSTYCIFFSGSRMIRQQPPLAFDSFSASQSDHIWFAVDLRHGLLGDTWTTSFIQASPSYPYLTFPFSSRHSLSLPLSTSGLVTVSGFINWTYEQSTNEFSAHFRVLILGTGVPVHLSLWIADISSARSSRRDKRSPTSTTPACCTCIFNFSLFPFSANERVVSLIV